MLCFKHQVRVDWSERDLMQVKSAHEFDVCLKVDILGLPNVTDGSLRKVEESKSFSLLVPKIA